VYNLLSRLRRNHEITLVTFLRSLDEKRYEQELAFCKKIITCYRGHAWQPGYVARSFFGTMPLLLTSYNHRDLQKAVGEELATHDYDLIHVEPWYAWPSVSVGKIPVVLAAHNIEYEVYTEYVKRLSGVLLRPGYYWDVVKLRHWEENVWKSASRVVAVSERDARVIRHEVGAHGQVAVIPNGVDLKQFHFRHRSIHDHPALLFVGSFSWMQNRDAVDWLVTSIWPVIRRKQSGATMKIVGRKPPDRLRRAIESAGATLLEDVEDISVELNNAHILIAPIRIGGGTSFKILEAMASGVGVVTTPLGATGLDVSDGRELLIGKTADEIAGLACRLVRSPILYRKIAQNARKTIVRGYQWDTIAQSLDRLWYETAKNRS
jgi:glycosyltransferase involved in cell wall biosynthesis